MNRFAKITLDGFKGRHETFSIDAPTLFCGGNGSGKSAVLDALVYCLTGRTPAGKTNDAAAQYFGPRGGTVTVERFDGAWLRRGVSVDHEKAKVSEILESSLTLADGTPDMQAWHVDMVALDTREFLALSPAKRREYFLGLCGGGDGEFEDVLAAIAAFYAKEIAGPAATSETLDRPEDLPEDAAQLAREWTRPRGVKEVLRSYREEEAGLAGTFLRLGEAAREQRLAARRQAVDARSAIRELEAAAQEARLTSMRVEELRAKVEAARDAHTRCREESARLEEANAGAGRAQAVVKEAETALAKAEERIVHTQTPGECPTSIDAFAELPKAREEVSALNATLATLSGERQTLSLIERDAREAGNQLAKWQAAEAEHKRSPWGKTLTLLVEIPDSAHPRMAELKALVAALARSWCEAASGLAKQVAEATARLSEIQANAAEVTTHAPEVQARIDKTNAALAEAKHALALLEAEEGRRRLEYKQRLAAWNALKAAYDEAQAAVNASRSRLASSREEHRAALERAGRIERRGDAQALEAEIVRLKAELQVAESAAGTCRAYDDALDRARAGELAEAAWKAAEKAVTDAREVLVSAGTRGLLGDIDAILEKAGRVERAFLELENARGRPVFALGWRRNGTRVGIEALSAGEAALFAGALSYALVKRAAGTRLLLCELDALDEGNLERFLAAFAATGHELDVFLAATHRRPARVPEDFAMQFLSV